MKKFPFRLGLFAFASFSSALHAGVSFYVDNASGFNAAASTLEFKGIENWEESTLGAGLLSSLNDPLAPSVGNGTFPTGTNPAAGISVQSNTSENGPSSVSPRGSSGLAVISAGYIGSPSDQVGTYVYGDSFDIIVNPSGNYSGAVSLNSLYYHGSATTSTSNPGTVRVRVYDASNTLLGTQDLAGVNSSGASFLGIVATAGSNIRRINIASTLDPINSGTGADNISVFGSVLPIPEPAVTSLAVFGVLGLTRRRRV